MRLASAVDAFVVEKKRQPTAIERIQLTAGLRALLGKLASNAAIPVERGYAIKVQKYNDLQITSGVAPMSISLWGFEQRMS